MSVTLKLKPDVVKRRCRFCGHIFSKKSNLFRHIKNCHNFPNTLPDNNQLSKPTNDNDLKGVIISLRKQIDKQSQQIEELKHNQTQQIETIGKHIEELKEKPNVTNNILQVVCVRQDDNYLDMLTNNLGCFYKALDYVKGCALSDINGDCQLIKRIYFDPKIPKPSFHYTNTTRNKIQYFNENGDSVIDKKHLVGRKLANNLQNSYLKGVNHAIMDNVNNNKCPNKFLDEYDLQTWNKHIYNLSDPSYQKKFMNQLDIPDKDQV